MNKNPCVFPHGVLFYAFFGKNRYSFEQRESRDLFRPMLFFCGLPDQCCPLKKVLHCLYSFLQYLRRVGRIDRNRMFKENRTAIVFFQLRSAWTPPVSFINPFSVSVENRAVDHWSHTCPRPPKASRAGWMLIVIFGLCPSIFLNQPDKQPNQRRFFQYPAIACCGPRRAYIKEWIPFASAIFLTPPRQWGETTPLSPHQALPHFCASTIRFKTASSAVSSCRKQK